jgi:hypothetical protein
VSAWSHDTTVGDTKGAGLCWSFYSIRCESARSISVRSNTRGDQRDVRVAGKEA